MELPAELERFWRTDHGLTTRKRAAATASTSPCWTKTSGSPPQTRMRQNDAILNEAEMLYAAQAERGVRGPQRGDRPQRMEDPRAHAGALIDAKRAMGRPRDLHAVLELEAIRERLRGEP